MGTGPAEWRPSRFILKPLAEQRIAVSMRRSGYVVAIVDDDASMRGALGRLLRAHGVECRTYPSARAFIETLSSCVPHCLIVDVNMPGMTGLELQQELSRAGFRIPTIVVTANDDERVASTAVSLGATAFFLKPVATDELMAAVISCSERSAANDAP
jgi:FixJ family two-component response regulator